MLEDAEAVRFDRVMTKGKTEPILVACERATGEEIEVIGKFSYGCDNSTDGLVRESFAAMLAKDLGLPIPEPVVVHVSPEFIQGIDDQRVSERLRKSVSLGFGSKKLPDGFSVWTASSGRLSDSLLPSALEIFAFDCFLTNGDRRVSNPNLQFNGKSFAIFDHELAFMTTLNLCWVEPWRNGALTGFNAPTDHVFFDSLRGGSNYDLTRFSSCFSAISDVRIDEYVSAIPTEWHGPNKVIETCAKLIADMRDNIQPAVQELMRALK
jgi:hypothetical protein